MLSDDLKSKLDSAKLFPDEGGLSNFLLKETVQHVPETGLFLEFGVFQARSIKLIRNYMDQRGISEIIYGFDSFEGLPEDWMHDERKALPKGEFACNVPQVPEGVTLVKGYFQDTLPDFLAEHDSKIAFAHIDCDLFSSADYVLRQLQGRLTEGSVLQFDEAHGDPLYVIHEGKALSQFLARTGWEYEMIGKTRFSLAIKF